MPDFPTRSLPPEGEATADQPASAGNAPTASGLRPGTFAQTPSLAEHAARLSDSTEPSESRRALPEIPGYKLEAEIGSGGMGVVYRARELAFDRDVAVKILQDRYPAESSAARRFLDEARITGQLQHPAIPPVHHIGTLSDGRLFLAMKLIKGDTLAELLDREPGNRGRFVAAFAQVCQAVAYAHSRKVIHRDLKPANVMVGAFGEVQLMDWGLAKVLTGAPEPTPTPDVTEEATEIRTGREADSATQAGSVLGTPAFMAPEQAAGEVENVDERSDVFGLGAMLCTILTGKPPYAGPSTDSVRIKAVRCETADAFARLDACSADAELVSLCKRCLAAEREARPGNAGEVAKAVSAHLAAVEERAREAELERVRAEERRTKRRVQFALAAVALLLLAAGAVGAGFARLWKDAEAARAEAEHQRGVAEAGRVEEGRLRGVAEKAQADETEARKQVEREREKLAVFEYGRTMQLAHQAWRDGNLVAMRALLDGTNPKLRGWEWRYLDRLYHGSLLTFKGHKHTVHSASFSPDGSRIVTGGWDQTAKLWDAKTGAELLTLKGHTAYVYSASFSPDGTHIVTGSDGRTAKVWDAKTGAERLTLKGHTGSVFSASFSPDGTRIVTGSVDNTAKVWDSRSGAEWLADLLPPLPIAQMPREK